MLIMQLIKSNEFTSYHMNKNWPHMLLAYPIAITLKVLVTTIDARWEGMGNVGSARYEPALLPPCPTIRVLSYSN